MPRLLPKGERSRRVEYLAPLFAYCRERGVMALVVARRACMRRGEPVISKSQLNHMRMGEMTAPAWLVAECCRELGRPVTDVMGAEWVAAFGNTHPEKQAS